MSFYLQFDFTNFPITLTYSLFLLIQLYCFLRTQLFPHMFVMFSDSIALLLQALVDLLTTLIKKLANMSPTTQKPKPVQVFKKKVKQFYQTQIEWKQKLINIVTIISLGFFTSIASCFGFLIFSMFIGGLNGSYFMFNLLFTWSLFRLWSNMQLHRHHILALIIMLIGSIIVIVINRQYFIVYLLYLDSSYWLFIVVFIGIIIPISAREMLEKYALDILCIDPNRILAYEGLVSFIINWIIFGIFQLIDCTPFDTLPNGFYSFCMNSKSDIMNLAVTVLFSFGSMLSLWCAFYFLSTFVLNTFRIILNQHIGPTHRYNGDIIAYIVFTLIYIILYYSVDEKYGTVFNWGGINGMILMLIGSFIYNENIRIYLFKMADNTWVEIKKRSKVDGNIGTEGNEILANDEYDDEDVLDGIDTQLIIGENSN